MHNPDSPLLNWWFNDGDLAKVVNEQSYWFAKKLINDWEIKVTKNMSDEEVKTLKALLFKVVEP